MSANAISAINADLTTATINTAHIPNLSADKITSGDIDAARIKANVVTAINNNTSTTIDGDKITTGSISANRIDATSGTFNTANIPNLSAAKITSGDISADRMKTYAISAINADLSSATINSAHIPNLSADKITSGDISADRMKTYAISAINADLTSATINEAHIPSLSANKIDVLTKDGTSGVYLHPSSQSPSSGSEGNSVKVDNNGMEVFKGGTSVAKYGDTTRVGKEANGYARTLINTGGMQVIQKSSTGTDIVLANIGYDLGNAESGTAKAPYYTLGTRGGSTVGNYSVAEGSNTTASGPYAHAEGADTQATGLSSHAEGAHTIASGHHSHAEGYYTQATNMYTHAEGWNTKASFYAAHAQNIGTEARSEAQTAIGTYNVPDGEAISPVHPSGSGLYGVYAFIIGNGTSSNATSNAFTVDWKGNVNIASNAKYKIGGTALAPSDLGVADYITAKGTSGDWTYEKYASGKVEAFFYGQLTGSTPTQTSTYYYRSSGNSFSIPSGIFPAAPKCVGTNIDSSSTVMFGLSITMTSATAGTWQVFRTNANAVSFSAGAHFVYTPSNY